MQRDNLTLVVWSLTEMKSHMEYSIVKYWVFIYKTFITNCVWYLRFNKVLKLQILASTQSLNHFQNILHIYFNFLQSHHQWSPKNVHINKLSLKNHENRTDIYQKDGKESLEDHILNRFEGKDFL